MSPYNGVNRLGSNELPQRFEEHIKSNNSKLSLYYSQNKMQASKMSLSEDQNIEVEENSGSHAMLEENEIELA